MDSRIAIQQRSDAATWRRPSPQPGPQPLRRSVPHTVPLLPALGLATPTPTPALIDAGEWYSCRTPSPSDMTQEEWEVNTELAWAQIAAQNQCADANAAAWEARIATMAPAWPLETTAAQQLMAAAPQPAKALAGHPLVGPLAQQQPMAMDPQSSGAGAELTAPAQAPVPVAHPLPAPQDSSGDGGSPADGSLDVEYGSDVSALWRSMPGMQAADGKFTSHLLKVAPDWSLDLVQRRCAAAGSAAGGSGGSGGVGSGGGSDGTAKQRQRKAATARKLAAMPLLQTLHDVLRDYGGDNMVAAQPADRQQLIEMFYYHYQHVLNLAEYCAAAMPSAVPNTVREQLLACAQEAQAAIMAAPVYAALAAPAVTEQEEQAAGGAAGGPARTPGRAAQRSVPYGPTTRSATRRRGAAGL